MVYFLLVHVQYLLLLRPSAGLWVCTAPCAIRQYA